MLIIFVAIFIWYSNSFFTRKRKKEVGLYSLLGVRKKQIGRMLFYENFLMGVLALLAGMVLGSVLTRFFVSLLMKVMGYDAVSNFDIACGHHQYHHRIHDHYAYHIGAGLPIDLPVQID